MNLYPNNKKSELKQKNRVIFLFLKKVLKRKGGQIKMNQFIYNGSHLGTEESDCLLELANEVSIWVVYKQRKQTYEIRYQGNVLKEVDSFIKAQLFIEGMKVFSKNEKAFDKVIRKNYPDDMLLLQKELDRTHLELEKTKKLAENLIKGIVKNGKEEAGKDIPEYMMKKAKEEKVLQLTR